MEQVRFILTEYAGWICMGMGILAIVLLAITLRRIKRMRKQQKELQESIRLLHERVEWVLELQRSDAARKQADVLRAKQSRERRKDPYAEHPEELINAVLGEVFP